MPHYILNEEIANLARNAIDSFKGCSVISVDDGSPYETSCLEKSSIVIKRQNGGFAKAMNSGLIFVLNEAKEDDLIVCVNNDVEARGDWVNEVERCFNEFKADIVGGLGYRCYEIPPNTDNRVSEGGLFSDWMFPGGFFIAKRKFFDDCGIYDENYRHGGVEDIDLFYTAKQKGKRLIMTPRLQYWHKEGATRYSDTQKGIQNEAILINEQYFKDKYGFHPIKHLNEILTCNYLNP
jgi:GT2 family glycosyltransferase